MTKGKATLLVVQDMSKGGRVQGEPRQDMLGAIDQGWSKGDRSQGNKGMTCVGQYTRACPRGTGSRGIKAGHAGRNTQVHFGCLLKANLGKQTDPLCVMYY